jgi:hypothetical protein
VKRADETVDQVARRSGGSHFETPIQLQRA